MEREDLRRRVDELEAINAGLLDSVRDLAAKHDAVPGVVEHRKDWYVLVGGERVELKAIPPVEWVRILNELPGFLFGFAMERVAQPSAPLSDKTVAEIETVAKQWLTACAVDTGGMQLDRLSFPEAQHAVAHIAELNGVTAYMRTWFRRQFQGVAGDPPGGEDVRAEAEQPPGDQPN